MKKEYISPIDSISVFSTALCNLKCSYCYICKNGNALKGIDREIEKDHKELNYIKQLKQFSNEDIQAIRKLDIWGGEPLLHIERILDSLHEYFELLPKLDTIFFSTNFTVVDSIEKIKKLIQILEEESVIRNKKMYLEIQISIDGYEEINDMNRGLGTTQKILDNFHELLKIDFDTNKLRFKAFTKPTLSTDSFCYFQTETDVYKYYNFFETEFYQVWKKSKSKILFYISIPNYAEPFEYTKEDGIELAKIFKRIQYVESNFTFEGYTNYSLVPYAMVLSYNIKNGLDEFKSIRYQRGGGCGHLKNCCTLVPFNRVSACHRGFFDDFKEYADIHNDEYSEQYARNKALITAENRWNYSMEEFEQARKNMNLFYNHKHKTKQIQIKVMLQLYAQLGLVDEKYKDDAEASLFATVLSNKSMCVQNNIEATGSMYIDQCAMLKLLGNGAFDIILEEIERYKGVKK